VIDNNAQLTRRQLREAEANANKGADRFPRRRDVAARTTAPHTDVAARNTAPRSGPAVGTPKRKPAVVAKRAKSSLVSMGAMLFAGAMLVGLSVPANLFHSESSAVGDEQFISSAQVGDIQSLEVAGDAVIAAPARDGYSVTSYAEQLRAKYSTADYTYAATTGAIRWPFPYAVPISSPFGPRDGGFHKGTDFNPGAGAPIYAIADGIATISVEDSTYGQHVILAHNINGQRLDTLYAHMISASSPIVAGQQVKVGDFLGLVGDTGISTGPHLHFEVRLDGVPVDPFAWLQANAVN